MEKREDTRPAVFLGGKSIPLTFDMEAWARMEDEICLIGDLEDRLNKPGRIRAAVSLTAILAHDKAVTGEWILKHMHPSDLRKITDAITAAIARGMAIETEQDEGGVHDAVLEDLEKKETPGA